MRERAESQAEWSARLARWKRSGLSADQFARREGVRSEQLVWWRGRLKTLESEKDAEPVRLVELVPEGGTGAVEVVLRSGAVVRVGAGFDENTVMRLVRLLDGVHP